ncbi:unnamed protein product [Rhizoctonia solani]|uniref:Uncharacterized protein n=1 Tax=Rhizoctonia solani TaxID=456999 RepID=A0A8H3GHD6_9AGAM|nr:unnamed protein product [Rhizoctonia solani]
MAGGARSAAFGQSPTECADGSMTLWMHNNDGKNPCELVQDVLRVCDPSFHLEFLQRGYTCDNAPGSTLSPCCCGSPTFALMSACWSCQYNITFDLVSTTFTGFVKDCQTLPNPITSYDPSVRSRILALDLPPWSEVEPLAGKWDFAGAWRNSTPSPTAAPPVPTGYPIQVNSTGISKGALAGAIVGAILGSKILFMLAGYLFYRWWKKKPGRDDDDDEKGYVHHVFGSRAHVDLDEGSDSQPRWRGIPSYLQPGSFHSQSSAGADSPVPGQQGPNSQGTPTGPPARGPDNVIPYVSDQRPVESVKTRERRRSQSNALHVANMGGPINDEENRAPAPQPELLPHSHPLPQSVSSGPGSPDAVLNSPPTFIASRAHSHADSISTTNLPRRSDSTGSGSRTGYQEDDAGYRIVIEGGNGGQEVVRSVPPAYVDYRKGYSNAGVEKGNLARQDSAQAEGSNNTHEGSSQSAGSAAGKPSETSDNTSATCINSSSNLSHSPSLKKVGVEGHDTDTIDAKTITETNTVREPQTEHDHRDRTESGDSEGAVTIKPPSESENPGPIERSSTSDLAALTAANTAANRPNTSGSHTTYHTARPDHTAHTSAPAGVTFSEPMPQGHDDPELDVRQTSDNDSPPKNEPPPATTSSAPWSWGRALGAFGLGGTGASSS